MGASPRGLVPSVRVVMQFIRNGCKPRPHVPRLIINRIETIGGMSQMIDRTAPEYSVWQRPASAAAGVPQQGGATHTADGMHAIRQTPAMVSSVQQMPDGAAPRLP